MPLLGWLTVVYAAVLVLALVAVLSVAAWRLWRIGSALGRARSALAQASESSRALEPGLKPLHALAQRLGELESQNGVGS